MNIFVSMDRSVSFISNKQSKVHHTNTQILRSKLKINNNNNSIQIQFKIIDSLKQKHVGHLRNIRIRLKYKNIRQNT